MKKLLFLSLAIIFFASCKDENTNNHPEKHSSFISFIVSNSANIGSFNVYLNENLVGQISSGATDSTTKYSYMHDDITQHPITLNYSIEPMFYDSTNASSDISLSLSVDEQVVAETPTQPIGYNETIRLSHTVE